MRNVISSALLFGTSLVASCGCPIGTKPLYVETGSYKVFGEPGGNGARFPSSNAQGKTMVIDREANTVRFSYSLNGKQYVETYRVSNVYGP